MKPFFTTLPLLFLLSVANFSLQAQCLPVVTSNTATINGTCGDANPTFDEVTAASDCCDIQSILTTVVETGAVNSECSLSAAYGPGPDWAFYLPGIDPAGVAWFFDEAGQITQLEDGNALITGHIYSGANPTQGFNVHLLLENARNWDDWSSLGRWYKDILNLSGGNHVDWTYYELAANYSYLEGTGELAGSNIQLTHKPSNYYYGFQIGLGANDKNANFGISGWFYYSGMLNGQAVSGHGDINADAACSEINSSCGSTSFANLIYVEDACGNIIHDQQVWNATDNEAPVFEAFENEIEIACEEYTSVSLSATDNCSGVTVTFEDAVIEEGCNGTIIRTFTAVDGCGNTSTALITIHLLGDIDPVFDTFPGDATYECGTWNESATPGLTYSGGCSALTLTYEDVITPGECSGNYTVERIYTVSDDCGNSVSQSWVVTIVDTTPPVLYNVPPSATLSCGEEPDPADVFALDNCQGLTPVGINAETVDLGCEYVFTRSWISTDGCGNTATASQVVTIIDDTPPVFTYVPENQIYQCTSGEIDLEFPIAEDACGDFTMDYTENVEENGCETIISRTFTATDFCGNSSSVDVVYTVTDNIAPEITFLPEDMTFSCAAGDIPQPEAIDNCSTVDITYFDELTGDCGGSFTRTYFISDECGNTVTHVQNITVIDDQIPYVVFMPENVVINCGETFNEADYMPVFADDCGNITVTRLDDIIQEGNCPGEYTLLLNWMVEDPCGNRITPTLSVLFTDNEAPVLSEIPADAEVECGADFEYLDVTAFDVCMDSEVDVLYTEEYEFMSCGYVLTRTWTATDLCGNTSTGSQTVTFVDTEGPVFQSFPEDFTAYCGDEIPATPLPTAEDACDGEVPVFVTENIIPGACDGEYYIQRLFRAFDNCGNSGIYFQTITVIDNVGPEFLNPQEFVQLTCTNNQMPLVNVVDACSSADVFFEDSDPSPLCGGIFERYYTAIDACGNVSTFTQTIQLVDETPPVFFNLPAPSLTIECGSDVPDVFIFAQDNCSGITPIGLSANTVETECGYIFTRTWITSDNCGNTAEYTQTITTVDTTAPELSEYPEDLTINCNDDLPPVPQIFAEDACNGFVAVDFQEEIIGISACPVVERTWCAQDCVGNEVCHTQTITLVDNQVTVFRVDPTYMADYNVRWSSSEADHITCEVYNISGQLVNSLYVGETAGGVLYNIPFYTANMAPGIYIVKMTSSAGVDTKKVVIK